MKLKVRGKKKLEGIIKISGSKNSALAIIASCILTDEEVTLRNVPEIDDVKSQIHILEKSGFHTYFKDNILIIRKLKPIKTVFLDNEISNLRGSYYLMGACLARYKKIKITNVGGCNLGDRPIDYHLDGFRKLNVKVIDKKNYLYLKTNKLMANTINLKFPSVGATINLMIASVKAKGTTIIENASLEPEVSDVGNFLISMGAKIEGLSTNKLKITGVNYLHKTDYIISSDRIEAGTYLILGAMITGDYLKLENVQPYHLKSLIDILKISGANIECGENSIKITKNKNLEPLDIIVGPYPKFPTDLGPLISILMTQIEGTSKITETIFENRFSHIDEIKKTNVNCKLENKTLTIIGKEKLISANMYAHDLRCAAALLLCAIMAKGTSTIENIDVLFRGYEKPIEKLSSIGLNLKLEN